MPPSLADITYPLLLSLEEAAQGASREVVFARDVGMCETCCGEPPSRGGVCAACDGTGRTSLPYRLSIDIPAGVNDQVRLRVRGQGAWDSSMSAWGDLYLVCYLRPHERFRRHGFDLEVDIQTDQPVGGVEPIVLLQGPDQVTIGTLDDTGRFRIAGQGLPRSLGGGHRGDLVVRVVRAEDGAMQPAYTNVVRQARDALSRGAPDAAVAALDDPQWNGVHTAEGRAVLGYALFLTGRYSDAEPHLGDALAADPTNTGNLIRYGQLCAATDRHVQACTSMEAATAGKLPAPALRQAIASSAAHIAAACSSLERDPNVRDAILRAGDACAKRSYSTARALLQEWATVAPTALVADAAYALLSVASGNHAAASAASERYVAIRRMSLSITIAGDYLRAYRGYASSLADLLAAMLAAGAFAEVGEYPHACAALRRAETVARLEDPGKSPTDPIKRDRSTAVTHAMAHLLEIVDPARTREAGATHVRGLARHLRARLILARTGSVSTAWDDAARAVTTLELAMCQAPNDSVLQSDLVRAWDLMQSVGVAWLREADPDLAAFVTATRDAATARVFADAPVNDLMTTAGPDDLLGNASRTAYQMLFDHTRLPLRGEFLVAGRPGHFALTNYRLILDCPPPRRALLLPLTDVQQYQVRASGITTSSVVVALSDGRQVAVPDMPNGAFPSEPLMQTVVAGRMWESLSPDNTSELGRGLSRPSSVPPSPTALGAQATAPLIAAATPPPATCPACAQAGKSRDRFCRHCGQPMPAGADPQPRLISGAA